MELWQVGQRIAFRGAAESGEGIIMEVDAVTASEPQYFVELCREHNYVRVAWVWHRDVTGEAPVQLDFFEEVNFEGGN